MSQQFQGFHFLTGCFLCSPLSSCSASIPIDACGTGGGTGNIMGGSMGEKNQRVETLKTFL